MLVKEFLGHASLGNTRALAGSDDEFMVNATNDKEEIKKLLSVGFEYVCEKDGILYFRKRK